MGIYISMNIQELPGPSSFSLFYLFFVGFTDHLVPRILRRVAPGLSWHCATCSAARKTGIAGAGIYGACG